MIVAGEVMILKKGKNNQDFLEMDLILGAGSVKPQLTRLQELGVSYSELALR